MDTYNLYKDKCSQPNDIKNMLKDRLQKSWDSWPSKVWKMTDQGVQLVKEQIALTRVDRCTGILKGFWTHTFKLPRNTLHLHEGQLRGACFFATSWNPTSITSLEAQGQRYFFTCRSELLPRSVIDCFSNRFHMSNFLCTPSTSTT